ncbi:2'-5' RNA ligase family protein [Micromonospora sp. DT4]|uniref:2'-5' RNA ligase family protein n=1 Tax=Micromonospora sp. DT4 TaxID=3393438 RepID=UPI003CF386BB
MRRAVQVRNSCAKPFIPPSGPLRRPAQRHREGSGVGGVRPGPVTLDRVVVLDGSAPLVWLVRPTPALTALHAAVWDVLDQADGHRPWHAPAAWVPHLSLALRFRDADLRMARAVTGGQRPTGAFVAARSYDGTDRTVTPLR